MYFHPTDEANCHGPAHCSLQVRLNSVLDTVLYNMHTFHTSNTKHFLTIYQLCLSLRLKTAKGEVVELPTSLDVKVHLLYRFLFSLPSYFFIYLHLYNYLLPLTASSPSQGILGTDNRHYALDLFRLFPPDPNYTDPEPEAEVEETQKTVKVQKEEKSQEREEREKTDTQETPEAEKTRETQEEGKGKGTELKKESGKEGAKQETRKNGGYRHRLAVLRPELLETFLQ